AETRGRAPRRAAPAARAASPRAGRAPRTERTPRAPGPRGLTSSRDARGAPGALGALSAPGAPGAPGALGALGAYDDLRFGFPSTRVTRSAYRNPRGGRVVRLNPRGRSRGVAMSPPGGPGSDAQHAWKPLAPTAGVNYDLDHSRDGSGAAPRSPVFLPSRRNRG